MVEDSRGSKYEESFALRIQLLAYTARGIDTVPDGLLLEKTKNRVSTYMPVSNESWHANCTKACGPLSMSAGIGGALPVERPVFPLASTALRAFF